MGVKVRGLGDVLDLHGLVWACEGLFWVWMGSVLGLGVGFWGMWLWVLGCTQAWHSQKNPCTC